MAQKINPISFRLGTTQVWNTSLQTYGKQYLQYTQIFHRQLQIIKYLNQILRSNTLTLDLIKWRFSESKVSLIIYFLHNTDSSFNSLDYQLLLKKLSKTIHYWLKTPIEIRLCNKNKWFQSSELISNYFQSSVDQGTPPKKVLQNIIKIVSTQIGAKKVNQSTLGTSLISLKGFKIHLAGRFDNSRNQMAKSIKVSLGSLPLTNTESYVDYSSKRIHTKQGACGLQIWFFYEIL